MEKMQTMLTELKKDILMGAYGKSGERFLSIREFCIQKNVSFSFAHKLFHKLQEEHFLLLIKQIWYLTCGVASKSSALRNVASDPIIGIHLKEINNPYIGSIVANIQKILAKKNFRLMIQTSENDPQEEIAILQQFVRLGCAGVINFPSTSSNLSPFYRLYPLPLTFIGRIIHLSETEHMPCVLSDNYGISKSIAQKFASEGYNHFYYIGLSALPDEQNERLKGFRDGVNQTHRFDESNLFKVEYADDIAFKNFCKSVMEKANRENPALLFCVNDLYAAKIVSNFVSLKADIPQSISIVGYDDLSICQYVSPRLSSVAYSFSSIATQAVNLLFSINSKDSHLNQKIVISNYLNQRGTTVSSIPSP